MDETISYNELKELVTKSQNLILIDVRSRGEVAGGGIPGSINIPIDTLEAALQMDPDDFKDKYEVKKPALNACQLVFYCQSGRRGVMAMKKARQLGYVNARHYPAGYMDWCMRNRN